MTSYTGVVLIHQLSTCRISIEVRNALMRVHQNTTIVAKYHAELISNM